MSVTANAILTHDNNLEPKSHLADEHTRMDLTYGNL